ncbi:MAG: sugar phosphate isomerase/epimerase [Planctomycetes bacterium]|nr:sugar phosphate isomerase/epimerase [Planctomycetota bacterium]
MAGGAFAASALSGPRFARAAAPNGDDARFRFNYIVSAAMYGTAPLASVLDEVKKAGADTVDIWPKPHGDHREQMDQLGLDQAEALLKERGIRLGAITRYDLGPGQLSSEIDVLHRFGGKLIVTGAKRPQGSTVKEQVRNFVESMKKDVEIAANHGITIGIENHARTALTTPDSLRYFAELIDFPNFGLAMAPYHLPQDPLAIASLITDLDEKLVFFQAWEYGKGCMEKLPKDQELMQMPGRGNLDFEPIVAALEKINYQGWTEIFMHPTPRGIAIHETNDKVTAEINRSRDYLERCLAAVASS